MARDAQTIEFVLSVAFVYLINCFTVLSIFGQKNRALIILLIALVPACAMECILSNIALEWMH